MQKQGMNCIIYDFIVEEHYKPQSISACLEH